MLRSAKKRSIQAIFVANRPIPGILEGGGEMELCGAEPDAADERIILLAEPGDLVITRDIPLASRLVERSILVIDDRGSEYTHENIKVRLGMRNMAVELADNGLAITRIRSYGKKELKSFADSFDRTLTRLLKNKPTPYSPISG